MRRVDTTLQSSSDEDHLPAMERTLRSYASSLVVMRQFYDGVASGRTVLPHRVKRIAQRMISMAETDEGSVLALTTLANAHRDEAGRAVQSAILATVVARRLTPNRNSLAQLAMAALMADVGRVRIAGSSGERFVRLGDEVEKVIPALTSSLCISTGGVNVGNALRTVTAYESTHMERQQLLGALYKRALAPLVQSRILYVAAAARAPGAARQLAPDVAARRAGRPRGQAQRR